MPTNELDAASRLAVALLVGLVIGVERGWREREVADGGRVAGLRTFALVGLLGGVLGTGAVSPQIWPLAAGLLGLAIVVAVSYRGAATASGNLSITTAVAALLTYSLGALAAQGSPILAIAGATVTALLLNLKPTLHRWLQLIQYRELSAALQLLVLSVVVAPLLPNIGYGPYDALNPYLLWWALILVAGLSLRGTSPSGSPARGGAFFSPACSAVWHRRPPPRSPSPDRHGPIRACPTPPLQVHLRPAA